MSAYLLLSPSTFTRYWVINIIESHQNKRPDIYFSELATIIEAKVGRLVKASAHSLIQTRSTHTPFGFTLNTDDFFALSLGRSQRSSKGDGPFNPSDASGYVPATRGEYAAALGLGQTVDVLISEVTGASHPAVRSYLLPTHLRFRPHRSQRHLPHRRTRSRTLLPIPMPRPTLHRLHERPRQKPPLHLPPRLE